MLKVYYDILDNTRLEILPLFKFFKEDFYLAGGTALALQIGHRDSIDFDFFTPHDFETAKQSALLQKAFTDHIILKIQEEKNTLEVLIDGCVKLSFFAYPYDLLEEKIDAENFWLASIRDIACMKLSAILSRSAAKDYIDLYFILQDMELDDLLALAQQKFPDIDINLILKSLVYFEDVQTEPIIFKHQKDVDFETVKKTLIEKVKKSAQLNK